MTNSLVLKLALRFVRSRRKGALTRFISFAATCGIAIGVFAAIVGLSAMNGFEYELENRLRQSPHILATAPAIEQRAILSANRAFAPLMIAGIDPDKERKVIEIQRFVSTDLECLSPDYEGGVFGICRPKDGEQTVDVAALHTHLEGEFAQLEEDCEDCAVTLAMQKQLAKEADELKQAAASEVEAKRADVQELMNDLELAAAHDHKSFSNAEIEEVAHDRAQASGSTAYSDLRDAQEAG